MELQLLGRPRVRFGEEIHFLSSKSRAVCLAIYLAYKASWVSRDELTYYFCQDNIEERRKLRSLLYKTKQIPWFNSLEAKNNLIRLEIPTDVGRFLHAIQHNEIEKALSIYRGDLADGVVSDLSEFDEWLTLERQHLRQLWSQQAVFLARSLEKDGQLGAAASLFEKILQTNPLAEDVIQGYLRTVRDRQKGLLVFSNFAQKLQKEFGLDPLEETKNLVKEINVQPDTEKSMQSHLVGRENELFRLKNSKKPLVLVVGEAGIGKTSLLKNISGTWIHCLDGLNNVPYLPIINYLRGNNNSDLEKYKNDLSRLISDAFPGIKPEITDEIAAKTQIFYALDMFFGASNMIFDDLQWADVATIEFLLYLITKKSINRQLFATCRSEEMGQFGETLLSLQTKNLVEIIELQSLNETEIGRLVELSIKDSPENFANWLYKQSGGHPFFAHHIIENFKETRTDSVKTNFSEQKMQISAISGLIKQKFRHLSELAQRIINIASVLGTHFPQDVLGSVIGLSEWSIAEALTEAEKAGLVINNSFRHDITRQNILNDIPDRIKKLIHLSIAEKLIHKFDKGELAMHYFAADRFDKACDLWFEMASELFSNCLFSQSIQILQQIQMYSKDKEQLLACQLSQAIVFLEIGLLQKANECLLRTKDLSNATDLYLKFAWLKAKLSVINRLGLQEDANLYLQNAKNCLDVINNHLVADTPYQIIEIYTDYGLIKEETRYLLDSGQINSAIDLLVSESSRLQLALTREKHNAGLLMRLSNIQTYLSIAHERLGNSDNAIFYIRKGIDLLKKEPKNNNLFLKKKLYNLSVFLIRLGRLDEAMKTIDQGLHLQHNQLIDYVDGNLHSILSWILIEKGLFKKATSHAETALQSIEIPKYRISAYSCLLEGLYHLKQFDKCQKILDEMAPQFLFTDNIDRKAVFCELLCRYGDKKQMSLAIQALDSIDKNKLSSETLSFLRENHK